MSKVAKAVGAVVAYALGVVATLTGNYWAVAGLMKVGNYLFVGAALDVAADNMISTPNRMQRPAIDVAYSDTTSPGWVIYGRVRTSGMNVIPPWKSGEKLRWLHQGIAHCAHEVDGYEDVLLDKDVIASGAIAAISSTVNDGNVTTGKFANAIKIRRYNGTSTQTVDFILHDAFPGWTENHKGIGIAWSALAYDLENDEAYEHGLPEYTTIIRGKRCYDPRLDTAPGAHPTIASYITFTSNPALCTADYLTSEEIGCGEDPANIDWDSVVAAANICDEAVAIPGGTQPRYTCNVKMQVAAGDPEQAQAIARQNLQTLAGSMMGAVDYRGEQWRMHAGAADDSTFALTADHLVGKYSIRTAIPAPLRANYIRGQFVDPTRNWQVQEYEGRGDPAYEAEDLGERYQREVHFPACTNQNEAQRNAIITLKRARRATLISGTWTLAAYPIRCWDTGTLDLPQLGINSLKVRCIAWKFLQVGQVEATFLEEVDADWDDPPTGDYIAPGTGAGPSPTGTDPFEITGFNVESAVDGVRFNIEHPAGWLPGDQFEVWMHTAASPVSSAVLMRSSRSDLIFVPLDTSAARYWWVRHRRRTTVSDFTPDGDGVQCAALALTDVFHANASSSTAGRNPVVGTSTATSVGTVTITPIKGVSPYTCAWTRTSGSTKVTAIAASSFTTGFKVTGIADGDTETATFRCRVTDSTGGTPLTFDVFVKVTFRRDDNAFS